MRYSESGPLALDTNVLNAVTANFPTLTGSIAHDMYVLAATGTHATHQVQIQGSPDDGTTWFTMWTAVTGTGFLMYKNCLCPLLRAKVVVAEGVASTCNIYFFSA